MLSPDPVKRGLNPYPYCDNDPVNYNDPTGEIPSILAGGLLGGFFGGASGFLGSTISQVMSGEKFSWRKALGSTGNGAVVGAAKGALIGSGAGIPAAFAADFAAGASGNALEQWITKGRVDARESLLSGAGNALSELLYGTGEIKGLGDAFIRGARTGAVMSGIENLAGAAGLYGQEPERNPRGGGHSRISGRTGRDPRGMCGCEDPFDLGTGLGRSGRGYHGEAGRGRTDNGGFSLGGFVKDVLTGAAVGGLGSAGFYGAGKAVEALKGSFVGRRDQCVRDIVPKPNHGQGFSRKGYNPQAEERTFEGYIQRMVSQDAELSLYTSSKYFNNVGNIGGEFKRFGTIPGRHGIDGVHVHLPMRNVNLVTGEIRGGTYNSKKGIGVDSPNQSDIKQLYQFFFNEKYNK